LQKNGVFLSWESGTNFPIPNLDPIFVGTVAKWRTSKLGNQFPQAASSATPESRLSSKSIRNRPFGKLFLEFQQRFFSPNAVAGLYPTRRGFSQKYDFERSTEVRFAGLFDPLFTFLHNIF
jgi:hypothetical protein